MIPALQQNSGRRKNKLETIGILAFSLTGYAAGEKLQRSLTEQGKKVSLDVKSRYAEGGLAVSHMEWTEEKFRTCDALIFIGACGIAVRSIAPFVKNKKTDPAVLVMDECGNHVISLLSGHLGGANALALQVSAVMGSDPVITTATDLHSRFAVDLFAKERKCSILHMRAAKEISAAILAGELVGFYSEFPVQGALPSGLVFCNERGEAEEGGLHPRVGVAVTIHKGTEPFPETAVVLPPCVYAGVGCRKGKDGESIFRHILETLDKAAVYPQALAGAASIDLKAQEAGLLETCKRLGIPFSTFSGEELLAVQGEFTRSSFVNAVTGVDNVCERSAVLASGGILIERKNASGGVTCALAAGDWRISFE